MLRLIHESCGSDHEALFLERYDRLRKRALQLTGSIRPDLALRVGAA
jgi:hypothetical protein